METSSIAPANGVNSTVKGILIGLSSAFGSAILVTIVFALIYFFRHTERGRIVLSRFGGLPGEYDDEQAFIREEAEALEEMDDLQRFEYERAKAFIRSNPPDSLPTDISLSQFLAIQEKGVSAWEFEPEIEVANCFVEGRTEIEFFDSECSVSSNLPIPKQNEVYYWESKIYDKPEQTSISIGMTTKPYPAFRLPGLHKHSISYENNGNRRWNQPFSSTPYGPIYVQGDVIGIGYKPRTGTVFFTRNGKKLDDLPQTMKSQNLFPTIGSNGPCTVHVNFGQMGFVFIEANVKKWGLAPMTGSLAPPPPYGSEQGSVLLETGRDPSHFQSLSGTLATSAVPRRNRSRSAQMRGGVQAPPQSPGPIRSPTDISLAQLERFDSDSAAGTTSMPSTTFGQATNSVPWVQYSDQNITAALAASQRQTLQRIPPGRLGAIQPPSGQESPPPPDYSSPQRSESDGSSDDENFSRPDNGNIESLPLLGSGMGEDGPQVPSYEAATRNRSEAQR